MIIPKLFEMDNKVNKLDSGSCSIPVHSPVYYLKASKTNVFTGFRKRIGFQILDNEGKYFS